MQLKTSYWFDDRVRVEVADFRCYGEYLAASLVTPAQTARRAVLFVVGGPQYRIGSHRQYLELARACAAAGWAAMIFDHRGMGDSSGPPRAYYEVQDDIRGAVDTLFGRCPDLESTVLFGLCDGATAALLYAATDERVGGLIIANPWLEASRSRARSHLKEYYGSRLVSRSFWSDLLRGRLNTGRSITGIVRVFAHALGKPDPQGAEALPLPEDVAKSAAEFKGPIHLMLSGRDVTARVFTAEMDRGAHWAALKSRDHFSRTDVAAADHTFSRTAWHEALVNDVLETLDRFDDALSIPPRAARTPRLASDGREMPLD